MRQETRSALNRTADLAARALHFLIADGKLAIRDVTTALSRRKKLVTALKNRFIALETESGVAGKTKPKARKTAPRKAAARKTVRAKAAVATGVATTKRTGARSAARKRVSAPKAAVRTVTAKKKPAQIVVTAGETPVEISAPAPKPERRKLPKVTDPLHPGTGTGPRDSSQI